MNPLCKLKALKDNTEVRIFFVCVIHTKALLRLAKCVIFQAGGCGDVSCVVVKTQSEARELEEQNRRLARRGQHQHSEIERLNKVSHLLQKTKTHIS